MKAVHRAGAINLTKVTRKGQVMIPEEIRHRYRIARGDIMLVGSANGTIMLRKLSIPSWSELFEYGEEFAKRRKLTRIEILNAVKEIRRAR